jgi:hypothetical protein
MENIDVVARIAEKVSKLKESGYNLQLTPLKSFSA